MATYSNTVGEPEQIYNTTYEYPGYISVANLDTDISIAAYIDADFDGCGSANIVYTEYTAIQYSGSFEFTSAAVGMPKVAKLDTTHAVILYKESTDLKAIVAIVDTDGNEITYGTAVTVYSGGTARRTINKYLTA